MKTLNIPLEDKEYEELLKRKGKISWHDFVMCLNDKEKKKNE